MKSTIKLILALVLIGLVFSTPNAWSKSKRRSKKTDTKKVETTTPTTDVTTTTTPTTDTTNSNTLNQAKNNEQPPTKTVEPAPIPVQHTPVVALNKTKTPYSGPAFNKKGKKTIGFTGLGYYEINSSYESLYVSFATNNINTAGLGFAGYFELGFSDKLSGELSLGYSRLLFASKFRTTIRENFFHADFMLHYYFLHSKKFAPYVIAGAGVIASGNTAAPTLDVGIGNYFRVSEHFSVKTELIFKTAITYNRGEARVGIGYHF